MREPVRQLRRGSLLMLAAALCTAGTVTCPGCSTPVTKSRPVVVEEEKDTQPASARLAELVLPPHVGHPAGHKKADPDDEGELVQEHLKKLNAGLKNLVASLETRLAEVEKKQKANPADSQDQKIAELKAEIDRLSNWATEYQKKLADTRPGEPVPRPPSMLLPAERSPVYPAEGGAKKEEAREVEALLRLVALAACIYYPAICPFVAGLLEGLLDGGTENWHESGHLAEKISRGEAVPPELLGRVVNRLLALNKSAPAPSQVMNLIALLEAGQVKGTAEPVKRLLDVGLGQIGAKGPSDPAVKALVEKVRQQWKAKAPDPGNAALDTLVKSPDGMKAAFRSAAQKLEAQEALFRLDRQKEFAGVYREYWATYLAGIDVNPGIGETSPRK